MRGKWQKQMTETKNQMQLKMQDAIHAKDLNVHAAIMMST